MSSTTWADRAERALDDAHPEGRDYDIEYTGRASRPWLISSDLGSHYAGDRETVEDWVVNVTRAWGAPYDPSSSSGGLVDSTDLPGSSSSAGLVVAVVLAGLAYLIWGWL